jgi:alpha-ribazole phosphatase
MTIEQIEAAGMTFDYRNRDMPVAPGGESRGEIERRSAAVVDELICGGGRHAIVTHGGPMRAMLVHALGLASSDIWAFHLRNAQLAFITVAEDGHGWLEEFRQA